MARPPAPLHPVVVSVWLAGVLALSAWRVCGWILLRSQVHTYSTPVAANVRHALDRLRGSLGVRIAVAAAESAWVQVPAVVGVFRPVILLPATALTGLTAGQLEAILAHELAHVRRNDYLVNLLQALAETLLFYHPAVWWVSARVREEREHCCDDIAANACGDRVAYARALATLEGLRVPAGGLALAASGDGTAGPLARRVRRLLGMAPGNGRHVTPARSLAAAVAAVSCALLPFAAARLEAQSQQPGTTVAKDAAARNPPARADAAADAGGGDVRPEDLVAEFADYRIGPEDRLQVLLRDVAGPNIVTIETVRVTTTGKITLPYIGQVQAAGLTEVELSRSIDEAFRKAHLVENANTGVNVTEALGRRFSVIGDAARAGSFELRESDYRVMDALVASGAGNEVEEVTVIRKAPGGGAGKPARVIRIPAQKLLAGELKYNVVLRPGDVVRVTGGRGPAGRLVAAPEGKLTFEGKPSTWEQLPAALEKIPVEQRARTRLVLVPASDEMSLKQFRQLQARAAEMVKQFGLKELATGEAEAPAKED